MDLECLIIKNRKCHLMKSLKFLNTMPLKCQCMRYHKDLSINLHLTKPLKCLIMSNPDNLSPTQSPSTKILRGNQVLSPKDKSQFTRNHTQYMLNQSLCITIHSPLNINNPFINILYSMKSSQDMLHKSNIRRKRKRSNIMSHSTLRNLLQNTLLSSQM